MPSLAERDAGDLWIFGYGSLVWRPDFSHVESRAAVVEGWARRFWQGSTDHRGVPGAPGRVVTLVEDPSSLCWGRAYRVASANRDAVLSGLDHRERGGFDRLGVEIRFRESSATPVPGLVYVANHLNANYLGPAPVDAIAEQVRRSRGPSGANTEYVLCLARALRDLEAHDDHVFAVAELVRDD